VSQFNTNPYEISHISIYVNNIGRGRRFGTTLLDCLMLENGKNGWTLRSFGN